jgi:putative transposase
MALANLAYRGHTVVAPDTPKRVQHQLLHWQQFKQSLIFSAAPKRWFVRTWIPLSVARIRNGKRTGDSNAPVLLDFDRKALRLYQLCHSQPGYIVTIPMPEWILERVAEGSDVKFAMAGLKGGRPYLALVAEREIQPVQPSGYVLVVDVNSWRHGIAWALIKGDRVIKWARERPDLGHIERAYSELLRLERKLGKLERLGLCETLDGRKLWCQIRRNRQKLYAYLRDFAQKLASRLARKAARHRARVVIDDMLEESRRGLLEERLPQGLAKVYLSGVRRFVRLFVSQLRWYGIPFEFRRLYSTLCPRCGSRMGQLHGRVMKCESCGFSTHRDLVPVMWCLFARDNGKPSVH